MKEKINAIKKELSIIFENIKDNTELNNLKVEYLGKNGKITELSKSMKDIANEEKKEIGILINEIREEFNNKYNAMLERINEYNLNKKLESESIDITLPEERIKSGSKHPLMRTKEELEDLFISMGFDIYDGPEIESDEVCFQKLNIPLGHPARDSQDTFYLEGEIDKYLLRTQTSTGQVRTMEANIDKGPLRIICPGKTYRRDDDATHSHQFMQCEGLVIDKNITLADLKGTLEVFARKFFGEKREIRLRPSYFPFTEPSVEVDISCHHCGGKGCAMCKGTGWIEILGAGMVNPKVLDMCGFDSKEYQGFAFGIGIERVAMLKYGIDNIRDFYNDDLRFLNQFQREE